jgi:hypothetical protein
MVTGSSFGEPWASPLKNVDVIKTRAAMKIT